MFNMTKQTMVRKYHAFSGADSYILGFCHDGKIYMVESSKIFPRWIAVDRQASSKGGAQTIRFRPLKKHKIQMLKKSTFLCDADSLQGNKGESFEKAVTEFFGKIWQKDYLPFWMGGDLEIDGRQFQIKFDGATICTEKQLKKLGK